MTKHSRLDEVMWQIVQHILRTSSQCQVDGGIYYGVKQVSWPQLVSKTKRPSSTGWWEANGLMVISCESPVVSPVCEWMISKGRPEWRGDSHKLIIKEETCSVTRLQKLSSYPVKVGGLKDDVVGIRHLIRNHSKYCRISRYSNTYFLY